jgi:hypothetical protein
LKRLHSIQSKIQDYCQIVFQFESLFGLICLALDNFYPAFGQELLPEAGTNQWISKPNTNLTNNSINNDDSPEQLPDSPLAPFFK